MLLVLSCLVVELNMQREDTTSVKLQMDLRAAPRPMSWLWRVATSTKPKRKPKPWCVFPLCVDEQGPLMEVSSSAHGLFLISQVVELSPLCIFHHFLVRGMLTVQEWSGVGMRLQKQDLQEWNWEVAVWRREDTF